MALTFVNVAAGSSVQLDDGSHGSVYIQNVGQRHVVIEPGGYTLRAGQVGTFYCVNGTPLTASSDKDATLAYQVSSDLTVAAQSGTSVPYTLDGQPVSDRVNALRWFHSKLASRDTGPVDIVYYGDSKTEGQGASTTANRWIVQLTNQLRQKYQPAGVTGGFGYVPVVYGTSTPASPSPAFTKTGTWTLSNAGLGSRSYYATAAATLTLTFTGTSVSVLVNQQAYSHASFSVQIDGGTTYTVADTMSPDSTYHSKAIWNSVANGPGALTAGSHTMVISWVSGTVVIEGAMIYNGDEASGVRMWDAGRYGGQIAALDFGVDLLAAPIAPALTFIAFGTNEWCYNRGSANFKTDLTGLIASIRTKAPNTSIVLLMHDGSQLAGTTPTESWANYLAAAKSVATSDTGGFGGKSGVFCFDLGQRMPTLATDIYGYHTSDPHHSDKGQKFLTDVLLDAILPR